MVESPAWMRMSPLGMSGCLLCVSDMQMTLMHGKMGCGADMCG